MAVHEYEGTFLKFVVTTTGEGAALKAQCTVIDLRTIKKETIPTVESPLTNGQ